MKLLIVSDMYYPHVGGPSRFTHVLAEHMAKRGHEVLVIAASNGFTDSRRQHDGVSVFGVGSVPSLFYKKYRLSLLPGARRSVERAIEEFSPDVIHVQDHLLLCHHAMHIANKRQIPIIATNHFLPSNFDHYVPLPRFLRNIITRHAEKLLCKRLALAGAVTTPTKLAKNALDEMGYDKEVSAISNGVDLTEFTKRSCDSSLCDRYGITGNKTILYVGRLDREKNIDQLILALKSIRTELDARLILVGKGEDRKRLEAIIKKEGLQDAVHFTGFVSDEDLPKVYNCVDCFAIASTSELQSIVTLQALASGLPVVAVDALALPELVHDENNGYLYTDGDIEALANALKQILSNESLAESMGKESLSIIQSHDIDHVMGQFEELYSSVT